MNDCCKSVYRHFHMGDCEKGCHRSVPDVRNALCMRTKGHKGKCQNPVLTNQIVSLTKIHSPMPGARLDPLEIDLLRKVIRKGLDKKRGTDIRQIRQLVDKVYDMRANPETDFRKLEDEFVNLAGLTLNLVMKELGISDAVKRLQENLE